MAHFVAFVYPEGAGFRVAIEGLGDAHAETLEEAEAAARAIAARSVFASYPDRGVTERPGTADRVVLELRLVRVASGTLQGPWPPATDGK